MASLTGQSISSTYDSLLKLTDNGPITTSFKEITDGLGGSTKLFVKNNGSFGFGAAPNEISADINVGVTGTSAPAFNVLNSTTGDYISLETASTFSIIQAGNTGAANYNALSFYVGGSERTKIGTTGQLTLNNYTSTSSFTGTVAGYLAFTSGGAIITTSAPGGGITTLNTLTASTQTFAVGTSGTDFAISSATSTHTFNLPTASATNRGALSSTDWSTFNSKIGGSGTTNTIPKFTAGSTLGNSNITDSGTLISLGSNTNISSGSLGIGSSTLTAYNLRVAKNITGGTTARSIIVDGTIQSDVTSVAIGIGSTVSTQATAFTLGSLYSFYSAQGTLGAGSAITAQYGYYADSTLIGGVSNYGFYGNLATAEGRWNLYMNGTANNYLAGNLGVGIAVPNAKLEVYVNANSFQGSQITNINTGNIAGSVTNYYNGTVNQKFGAIGSGFTTYGVLAANDAFVYSVGGGIALAAEGSNSIKFGTGTSAPERMRINSSGNVLIGSATDNNTGAKLQVTGSITYQNTFNRQSGTSYTLVLTDQNDIVEMNNANANTLNIPTNASVAFPIGTEIQVLQYGVGQTTIAGAGVTLNSKLGQLKIANRFTGVTLLKVGTNEWYVIGNLSA